MGREKLEVPTLCQVSRANHLVYKRPWPLFSNSFVDECERPTRHQRHEKSKQPEPFQIYSKIIKHGTKQLYETKHEQTRMDTEVAQQSVSKRIQKVSEFSEKN
jgi:hypothetical protein